jgi:hypothetical protein
MRTVPIWGSLFLLLATAGISRAQVKTQVVYDTTDANSTAVVTVLIKQMAAHPKAFTLVNNPDDQQLAVLADCYRTTVNDPYSCYYIASKQLGVNQALLGGAVVVKPTAQEAADALLASIAADISQRWNNLDHRMLVNELETCLALTESSCAVPDPLVPELKTKSINLSQYLRKKPTK